MPQDTKKVSFVRNNRCPHSGLIQGKIYDLSLGETKLSVQTLPRFFQLLTWTSKGKTVGTTGKSALKLLNLLSLKVIHPKRAKI